ncbi:hypothetical protein [Nocardia aurantia]|uniref:Uncharacterized protein n=1 Tax=Nocardia aurantia TaxID=2585199 RepID=A0A7K0DXC5_9NOCA|nr:hypothetical protein [Nocardia aurantia]MQY30436.1 hypothetical protein [Nocardia aurantia]
MPISFKRGTWRLFMCFAPLAVGGFLAEKTGSVALAIIVILVFVVTAIVVENRVIDRSATSSRRVTVHWHPQLPVQEWSWAWAEFRTIGAKRKRRTVDGIDITTCEDKFVSADGAAAHLMHWIHGGRLLHGRDTATRLPETIPDAQGQRLLVKAPWAWLLYPVPPGQTDTLGIAAEFARTERTRGLRDL